MFKEYGGYLPIELSSGRPFYDGKNVVSLNAGRYAIVYAIEDAGWKQIWLPYYLCNTVADSIRICLPQVKIDYYHINEQLLPDLPFLSDDEGLLWVNYFGVQPESVIDQMVQRYGSHLLIDQTQSFFSRPRSKAWQVYSCRKFFGVCDGSYVIHEGITHRPLESRFSSLYAIHLLHSLEYGTNYAYSSSKENEARLATVGIASMSPLTAAILNGIDYDEVQQKRRNNVRILHQILKPYNRFPLSPGASSLFYPFLSDTPGLREKLIHKKIYVPKLWEETSRNSNASPLEIRLSEYLCCLPIDQRYTEEDMQFIGATVLNFLQEEL